MNRAAGIEEAGQRDRAILACARIAARVAERPDMRELHLKALNNLGVMLSERGDLRAARSAHERSLRSRVEWLGEKHPEVARAAFNLALVEYPLGRKREALERIRASLDIQRRHLADTFSAMGEHERLLYLARTRQAFDVWLGLAMEAGHDPASLHASLLSWKGLLWARHQEERAARAGSEAREAIAALREARARLARTRSPEDEARKNEAERKLAKLAVAGSAEIKAGEISKALGEGEALAEAYTFSRWRWPGKGDWLIREETVAFVVRGGKTVLVELGPTAPLDRAVSRWREEIRAHPRAHPGKKITAPLVDGLWKPLEKALGDARTVWLAADGPFVAFPLEAIPSGDGYLLESRLFRRIGSGRDLLAAPSRSTSAGLLTLAEPKFGKGEAPLPGTRLEADRIRAIFQERFKGEAADLLRGEDATREKLASKAGPRLRWLHLATHGKHDPMPRLEGERVSAVLESRNPLLLGKLSLTSGPWTAEEAAGLDLAGCELAVLSACSTAAGQTMRGEGVAGLARAFHLAGARQVAASLWPVSDAATSVLMEEFYGRLWKEGKPAHEALREAQLTVMRKPELVAARMKELKDVPERGPGPAVPVEGGEEPPERSPPGWWAAFVLSGR